jgi:hypothetical protein
MVYLKAAQPRPIVPWSLNLSSSSCISSKSLLSFVLLHADDNASTSSYDMEQGDAAQDAQRANDVMRQHWNNAVRTEFDVPAYYTSVAVLLIRWADRFDESLGIGKQVQQTTSIYKMLLPLC